MKYRLFPVKGILGTALAGVLLWFVLFQLLKIAPGASLGLAVLGVVSLIALMKGIPALDFLKVANAFPLSKNLSLILGIVGLFIFANSAGMLGDLGLNFGLAGSNEENNAPAEPGAGASLQSCQGIASITWNPSFVDKYASGTEVDLRYIASTQADFTPEAVDNQAINSGGTVTLAPATTYYYIAGDDGDSSSDSSNDWYYTKGTFSTGCVNGEQTDQVLKEGTPTITIINSDGVTKNSATDPLSLSASGSDIVTVKVKAPSNAGFGNPECGNMIVTFADNGNISTVEVVGGSKVAMPDIASGNMSAWSVGFNSVQDGDTKEFQVEITATSTDPSTSNDVDMYLLDQNFFLANFDDPNGAYKAQDWVCGVETDALSAADVGVAVQSATIQIS